MIIKIARYKCLKTYSKFPLSNYNKIKNEEEFYFPQIIKRYSIILHAKSYRAIVNSSSKELTKLIKSLEFNSLIFLGDSTTSWLHQENDYKPAKQAYDYLSNNNIGKKFNGGIQVDIHELATFIKHISWLTRCNAALPYFHFIDTNQNIIGYISKYGDIDIYTLNNKIDKLIRPIIRKSKFEYINSKNYNFGYAIKGRQTIL